MPSPPLNQESLDRIAEEFSAGFRSGNRPSIHAYLARYPDDSGQLRQLLESIALIEDLKHGDKPSSSSESVATHKLSIDRLDDYLIVREIGRGGMGVVLEATDRSLHRQVAIKVLPHDLVNDSRGLDRFRREAKAAARLRHPNIVPVFGVGEASGYHYYVMDFIEGVNLRQWLDQFRNSPASIPTQDDALATSADDLSLHSSTADGELAATLQLGCAPADTDSSDYFRWVARLGHMISDALEYAHAEGVLHRDIKPANLLVSAQGNLAITDFGLAKVAEHQPVTRTGDVVGTPQYMAPEAFEGRYDERSETYAVGLTLFELLSLRPAITGKNQGEVIRNASSGVSVSPRKYNARIPHDLETIVLKAVSFDTNARYQSAAALRDDLHRFLHDQPISARRLTLPARVWRWSRRQPVLASLTAITFGSLLALTTVSAAAYFRTRRALRQTETAQQSAIQASAARGEALRVAEQQRGRAEANLTVALKAFDATLEQVWRRGVMSDAEILGEVVDSSSPDVSAADAEILQSLLGFFDELAANNSQDLRAESAVAGQRAGDIYQRLGRFSDASQAYAESLKRYQSLAAENPDNLEFTLAQVRVLNEQVVTASLQGQVDRASQLFDRAIAVLDDSAEAMASPEGRFEYARAHQLFASIVARAGADALPPARRFRFSKGFRRAGLARRSAEEYAAIHEAILVLRKLTTEQPDEAKFHVALARAYRDQAKVAARAGLAGEAERSLKQSIDHLESLLAENRGSDPIRYELAKTLASSESLGMNQLIRMLRAEFLSKRLLEESPRLPRYQALRAHVLEMLARHRHRVGSQQLAEADLNQALALYDQLIKASPDLSLYRLKKSQTLETFSDLKIREGQRTVAIRYLESALRELQQSTRGTEVSPFARSQLQRQRQKLNRIRTGGGKGDSKKPVMEKQPTRPESAPS